MKKYKYLSRAEDYALECRSRNMLANRAGFLRRERISPRSFREYCERNRDEAELIDAVFEDEALNTGANNLSATVLSLYLKSLLGQNDDGTVGVISMQPPEDAL